MRKLWLTVMAFGAILAVIPSDATAQKTGSKQSAQTAPAQPAAEWRKKRAVLGNVVPVTSGKRGELKNLAAKGDFSLSAQQEGAFYKFWVGYHFPTALVTKTFIRFKCKVKTEPSNPPGVWLDHFCQPSMVPVTSGGYSDLAYSVAVPEPAPFQQGFLKLTGFQVVATIDPDKQVVEWYEANNAASLTWE